MPNARSRTPVTSPDYLIIRHDGTTITSATIIMSDNRNNPPEIPLENINLKFELDGQQRQQPATPATQQNIDPALEQDSQRPQQPAAPETQHNIDPQLCQDLTLTQNSPQQSYQAVASAPGAVPNHVSGQNAGSTSQQNILDNPQPAIGGQAQQLSHRSRQNSNDQPGNPQSGNLQLAVNGQPQQVPYQAPQQSPQQSHQHGNVQHGNAQHGNAQSGSGGQPQQGIQVVLDQAPQQSPSLQFPQYIQPPDYEQDRQQVGDCLQMVAAFREAIATIVTPADDYRFRNFAGVGEWPREVFRFHCPYEPYQVVLYASRMAGDAAIDPRDGDFWDDLAEVARRGVRGGLSVIPRNEVYGGRLHQVAVRFMRVRDLDLHDRELRESNEVSDEEYWS